MVLALEDGHFQCPKCDFSSSVRQRLRCHIEAKHLETGGFVCPVCQKHCPTRNSLNIHRYRYHK